MPEFRDWIRETRLSKRMTQTECAARAGMKLQQWNQLEKIVKRPSVQTVQAVARGLDVSDEEAFASAGYASRILTEPDIELARITFGLTPEQRRIVLSVAKATRDSLLTAA